MHRSSVLAVVLTTAFVAVAAASAGNRAPDSRGAHRAAEARRLRAHFDSVDGELRARDVSGLSAAQRASRARLIAWLREYRDEGRFPENDRLPASAPFFRDSRGVLCAMGYLIDRSGRHDIVDDVARSRNNSYIRELADDPRLVAWLDSAGLTVAEAGRIQPTYGPVDGPIGGNIEEDVSRSYAISAASLIGASLATSTVNLIAPSRRMGVVGAIVGLGAAGLGVAGIDRGGEYRALGAVPAASGGVALATGIHAMRIRRRGAMVPGATNVSVSPALLGGATRHNMGLLLRARF